MNPLTRWMERFVQRSGWFGRQREPGRPQAALSTPAGPAQDRIGPPICNDIRAWCAQHPEADYRVVRQESRVSRQLPRTVEPEVDASFHSLLSVEVPERSWVRIPGARLVGPNGLVVLPDGSFAGELIALTPAGRQEMLSQEAAYTIPIAPASRRLTGRYCLLMIIGWQNYYHWNHDVIMRMQAYLDQFDPDLRFIAPGDLKPRHLDALKLLGIEEPRLVHFDGDAVWEIESLYVASPIYKTQINVPEPLNWFRERSQRQFDIRPGPGRRRIYLRRNFQIDGYWRPTNWQEVDACLTGHGFEFCHPGTLTFRQQAELFSEAEVIVGTGAGMTNMVFAPPGAKILQIQEPSRTVHAYWTMSEALGHQYWYMWGQSVANPGGTMPDIFVPIGQLEASLRAMLADPPSPTTNPPVDE